MIKLYTNIEEAIIDMGDKAESEFKRLYEDGGHNERSDDCIIHGSFIQPAPVEPVETQSNYGQYFIDNCVDQLWYTNEKGELSYSWTYDFDEVNDLIQSYYGLN